MGEVLDCVMLHTCCKPLHQLTPNAQPSEHCLLHHISASLEQRAKLCIPVHIAVQSMVDVTYRCSVGKSPPQVGFGSVPYPFHRCVTGSSFFGCRLTQIA